MESSTGDGGSDASYESVASEGGYEPASERGRDPLPRIISSAHCVEVFRRVRWIEGAFCCQAPKEDKGATLRRGPNMQHLRPHDPLGGLPQRLLRFDGAMEAWLEEMPLPRDPHSVPRSYEAVSDAASQKAAQKADLSLLAAGNKKATLWYFTLEFLQQLWPLFLQPDGAGLKLWEQALLDRGCTIQSTHIKVGQVNYPCGTNTKSRGKWLTGVFAAMQASKWTPDGEARSLLAEKRLTHASMSIGDAIQVGRKLYVAGLSGFIRIKEGNRLLPPSAEHEEEEEEEDEDVDEGLDQAEVVAAAQAAAAVATAAAEASGAGKGGRGPKEAGKGKGKDSGEGDNNNAASRKKDQKRAKEPAPAGAGGDARTDRRRLRTQLQAKRDHMQGSR